MYDNDSNVLPTTNQPPTETTARWVGAGALNFSLLDPDGVASFEILQGGQSKFKVDFASSAAGVPTFTAAHVDGRLIDDAPTPYLARLTDALGGVSERYFLLDRRDPIEDLQSALVDPAAGTAQVSAVVSDEGSGVAITAILPEGQSPPAYTGPVYPAGAASQGVSGSILAGTHFVHGRDRAGQTGGPAPLTFTMQPFSPPTPCPPSIPDCNSAFFAGNGGNILQEAKVNIVGWFVSAPGVCGGSVEFAGVPSDIGKVTVRLRSEVPPAAVGAALAVTSAFGPTDWTTVLTATSTGVVSAARNDHLAPLVEQSVETTPNAAPVDAVCAVTNPDQTVTRTSVQLPAGSITPTLGLPLPPDPRTVVLSGQSALLTGLDGDALGYQPVSGLYASVCVPPVCVDIPQLAGPGFVGAASVALAPPPSFHQTGKVYDVVVDAPYTGSLQIKLPHDFEFDFPAALLAKSEIYHNQGGTWTKCTSARLPDGLLCQTSSTSLFVAAVKDGIPPHTDAVFSGLVLEAPDGTVVISTRTAVVLSAADHPSGEDVDTGVRATYYRPGGVFVSTSDAGVLPYVPFTLPEGPAEFAFASEDFVHNVEPVRRATVAVDGTPPMVSSAVIGPFAASSSGTVLGPASFISLSGVDPVSNGVASGLGAIALLVDETLESCGLDLSQQIVPDPAQPPGSCQNPVYQSSFTLNGGTHTIAYLGVDNVSNLSSIQSGGVLVDVVPPEVSGLFPSSGAFGNAVSSFTVAWTLQDDLDPAPTAQARLIQLEDTGTPNPGSTTAVVALGQLFFAPELDDGSWVLEVAAQDWVLNSTVAYSQPFRIVHPLDSTPPVTQLTLGPPSFLGDPSFVSSQTVISLAASDDLSGVASLTYLIDGSTTVVSASSASFSLTQEGPHTLAFYAADFAGNVEAVQISSITVDNTPPVLAFTLSGSSMTDRLGRTVISTSTQLLLSAADALSGVGALTYSLDGGPEVALAVSSLALVFPDEGSHSLTFYALDRVENRSLSFSTSVVVDVSPPSFGTLSVAGADGSSGSDSTAISTTAASVQIPVSDLASGLDVTGAGSGPIPLIPVEGTLGLWHFDEPAGSVALNAGGPAGNGTLNPNVTREAGILGGAVRVGPNPASTPNSGVTLSPAAYSVINNMAAGTIELWAKLEQESTVTNMRHVFTLKQHNGSNTMFQFAVQQGPTNELWHASSGVDCNTLIQVDPTRWAHFAVTWDASAAKLYKDGALIRTCNGSFPVPNDLSPTCLSIAGACGDLTMNGTRLIDEVRVLNRALTAAEIAQDASDQAKPFAARLSTDGGLSFGALSSVELSGADGDVGPALLSASGLSLKASTSPADATNQVEFTVRDLAGHVGTVRKTLLVNLNRAVAPQALSPADASASSVPLVGFSWAPGPGVPEASITGYEFQYARDAAFTQELVTLSLSTGSAAVSLPEGAFFWHVAAFDRFGEKSPYSEPRRVFVDSQPPAFADAAVSTAPGAAFRPASLPVNGLLVSARASVRDLSSGLRITPAPGGATVLTAVEGTLGLWHFDEPSGSVALSAGGPAGNGTLNPNVTREAGILGGAVRVGPNPASTPNAGVTLSPGAYSVINSMAAGTIELWAKLEQESTVTNMRHVFTLKQHNGVNTMFQFAVQQGPTNELWHASSGVDCNTLIQVDPTRWAHFAVTWDAQAARLYKDGALIRTCSGSFPVPSDLSPTCLSIAGACGDLTMGGTRLIDEVRVLNRALSPAEIAQDAAIAQAAVAFSAALSTDGGQTFLAVDASSVSLTGVDGTTSPETLTALGLTLVESAAIDRPLNVVRFSAADLAGRSTDFFFSVLADTTPPSVAVSSPAAGSVFSALNGSFTPLAAATDRLDPAPGLTAELVQLTDEGGNGVLDRVAVSTGLPFDASVLDTGSWELVATALDFAGNASSAASGAFRIESDLLPPRTSLSIAGPRLEGTPLFVSEQSELSLSATDDLLVLGDALGVGVASSSYALSTPPTFQEYSSSFTLAEGAYDLRYFSADRAGNVEEVHLASVAVDGTGPAVALEFHAPFRVVAGTDTVFVRGLGPLAVSATDFPAVSGGVAAVYRSVDGGAAEASPRLFTLQEGTRTLAIWADDLLGNRGSTVTYALKLDATPPLPVSDLVVTGTSSATAVVSWTVPGDDGAAGDIFDAAIRLDFGPNPASLTQETIVSSGFVAAGSRFERTFTGLQEGTSYYAVAYTRDSAVNWSTASAVASARTYSVAVAASSGTTASFYSPVPAGITVVSTVTQAEAYAVAIASQGLAPSGGSFFELTSGVPFSSATPAVISFRFNSDSADPLSVFIYTYDTTAMKWSSASIVNQTLTQLSGNEYQITGEIYHTSLYAPMVRDTRPPETAFSVSGSSALLEGRLFAAGGSSGTLAAQERAPLGGTASGVASTSYRIGSGPDSAYASPFPLPEGDLTLTFRSADRSGNEEAAKTARIFVDASAPLLAYGVDQATFPVPGGFGTLSATVTMTLSALDPEVNGAASGLAAFSALLDGNPVPVSGGLLLGAGLHTLALSAADRLGNAAALTLKVAVGDTLPPVTTLSVGLPKAALRDGSVLVSGNSVLTLSAEDFAESGAPAGVAQTRTRFGAEAFSSYADAFGVPAPDGAKVLEYYSVDRAGNAEAPKSQALVRDAAPPGAAFSFPRPDEPGLCRLAQGPVQVRGTVSDDHLAAWDLKDGTVLLGSGTRNTEGLLGVWDATGKAGSFALTLSASDLVENAASASLTLAAGSPAKTLALGGKKALNKPRGVAAGPNRVYVADTNSDAVRVYDAAGNLLASFGAGKKDALKLNKPSGLAVDAYGNIFVADTGNKRVVKLSPGGILLAEYGGKKVLEKPVAVALAPGKVLVADAHAGELAVFSESGALLQRVSLPPVSRGHEDDDEEGTARPMALAADASGAVWVADAKGGRVLRFDAGLALTQTLAGFERPEGLAVSPSGSCLAVVDAKRGDVRTFDAALGTQLAAFASLHKPAQAVFTQDGQLLVAERNEDQVTGFGLPGTPLVVALLQEKEGKEGKQGKGKGFRTGAFEEVGEPPVVARVGRLEGGSVEEPRGGSVELPSGALPEDTDVSVAVAPEAGVAERQALKLAAASAPREFGPHGLAFAAPVTITLPYDPALLAGARPEEVKVHYWNAERGAWEALATRLDPDARTVSAQTTHFSLYQALVPMRVFGVLADPEATFSFRSVYAFPNPAVGGQRPSIHVAVGKADKVSIRIFDIAGTPVHEAALEGSPSVVSDDSGTHYAYEYTWDGRIPSGVYLYTVTAEKAGNAPIKRVGKLAVVR